MSALLWALWALHVLGLGQDGAMAARGGSRKGASGPGMYPEVREISMCPKKSSVDAFNYTSNFLEKTRTMMFSGFFNVARGALALTKLSTTIYMCKGGVSSNTCEYQGAINPKGPVCAFIMAPGAFWAAMVRDLQPTFQCPPRKGLYRLNNSTTDLSMISRYLNDLSADNWWIIHVEIEDEQKRSWICGKMTARLVPFSRQKTGPS